MKQYFLSFLLVLWELPMCMRHTAYRMRWHTISETLRPNNNNISHSNKLCFLVASRLELCVCICVSVFCAMRRSIQLFICYGKIRYFGQPLKRENHRLSGFLIPVQVFVNLFYKNNNKCDKYATAKKRRGRTVTKITKIQLDREGFRCVCDFCSALCVTCVCQRWTTTHTTHMRQIYLFFDELDDWKLNSNKREWEKNHKMIFFSSHSILTVKMATVT